MRNFYQMVAVYLLAHSNAMRMTLREDWLDDYGDIEIKIPANYPVEPETKPSAVDPMPECVNCDALNKANLDKHNLYRSLHADTPPL